MTRRKPVTWRVKMEPARLEQLAGALVEGHQERMAAGWVVCATSGVWWTRRGTLTVRIAYRLRSRGASIVHTIRGINPGVWCD